MESDDKLEQLSSLARQLEQRLRVDDLSRISDGRRRSPSKMSGLAILLGGLALITVVGLTVGTCRAKFAMDDRFAVLEAQLKDHSKQSQAPPSGATKDQLSPTVTELAGRLGALETLQEAWVSASKSGLEQMNFVFAVVAAFFGVFSLFLAYRQVTADAQQGAHEDEVRSLIGSFRQNMSVINDLIVTLEKTYSYKQEVQRQLDEVNLQLNKVQEYKKRAEQSVEDRIGAVNSEAIAIFAIPLDRQNFKSGNLRSRIEVLADAMNTLERTGPVEGRLNPFAFFARSLHEFNVGRYSRAESECEQARTKALKELNSPTLEMYDEFNADQVKTQLKRLIEDANYHLGIVNYNSGSFEKAHACFTNAFRVNPLDFRSRIYVPELRFFELAPFDDVVREFAAVERELNAISLLERHRMTQNWEEAMASLKMREGNIYLPKLVALPQRGSYRLRENAQLAVAAYKVSAKNSELLQAQTRGKASLPATFARFSLAQALEHLERSEWENWVPAQLYQQAMNELMNETVFKTEAVILVQLNYTMAICASRLRTPAQSTMTLLAKAREHLQRVPDSIRVFSPVNKIVLRRDELIAEMQFFEEEARHATSTKA